MPTAAPLESRPPDFEPEPAPLPTRIRVAVDDTVTRLAIQVLPPRLLAWAVRKRCLWRRTRLQRQAARARKARPYGQQDS